MNYLTFPHYISLFFCNFIFLSSHFSELLLVTNRLEMRVIWQGAINDLFIRHCFVNIVQYDIKRKIQHFDSELIALVLLHDNFTMQV